MSDNYDPRTKTLALSNEVARSPSVGALAIVAHEMGHAIQDDVDFGPLRVRSALVTPVNVGTDGAGGLTGQIEQETTQGHDKNHAVG